MPTCQGCGREGLKRSGILQHCRQSRDPQCQEYLTHLKHADIRSRRRRHRIRHSPTPTLNVSTTPAEALNPYDNLSIDLEHQAQHSPTPTLNVSPTIVLEDHMMDMLGKT